MKSPHIQTSTLIHLYVEERKTLKHISANIGMSYDGVRKRLIKAGVPRRSTSGRDHAPRPALG